MINENNSINETNQTVAMNVNNVLEPTTEETYEEVIEEGDIVIEEDFQINLEVADISEDNITSGTTDDQTDKNNDSNNQLGTEQSGNITF